MREGASLNAMWNRRQTTKFNGTAYIIQRGAEAVYSEEGQKQVKENIAYYQKNAKVIKEGLSKAGLEVYGAVNSPYVWAKTPMAWAAGSSSTCCWSRPTWSPPPAQASAPAAKGISA